MNYERPYYEDINYHPLMFYVIFGAKADEFMDNIIGGTLGKLLKEEQPELCEKIQKENIWAVVNGEIMQDDNLKYLRNTIGVVQAFLDTGAIAVLERYAF